MRERGLENDLEQKLEDLADKVGFEKLLAFAEDMCLQSPIEQPSATPECFENKSVVEQLGIRGLRAAVEIELGVEYDGEQYANVDKTEAYLTADSPLRYPNAFSGEFSYENAARIEAFGKGLINEAYDVLGPDADEYLEKFRCATNDEEQVEVLEWLDARIREIAHGDYEMMRNDGDEYDYHPARLSPKLMGSHPDVALPPTCLGVSLIAAGFFDKAEAQYMHAGVMTNRRQHELIATASFFIMVPKIAEDNFGVLAPTDLRSTLAQQGLKAMNQAHEDSGYHAATYAKLKSGLWYQLDPNFQSSTEIFFPTMNATLDRNYEHLNDLQSIAPGMELAVNMNLPGSLDTALNYLDKVKPETLPSLDDIDAFLDQHANADTLMDDVFERFIEPFFADASNDELTRIFGESIHKEVEDIEHEGVKITVLQQHDQGEREDVRMTVLRQYFQAVFTKYVYRISERTHKEFVESLDDHDERQETIATVRFLPFLIMANWANELINSNSQDIYEHQELEFGLPHHRIGAAVLSDIASHYDFGLSPKFWLSNWNSQVPITETLRLDAPTRIQQVVRYNNVQYTDSRRLTYRKSLGIIKSSLSSNTEG